LVVNGAHSTEFQSEKNYISIKNAVQSGITHITGVWK
jgi:hypothetical protein